jgi:hypothetical protein
MPIEPRTPRRNVTLGSEVISLALVAAAVSGDEVVKAVIDAA